MIAKFLIGAAASALAGRVVERYSQPGALERDRERLRGLQQTGRQRAHEATRRVRQEAAGVQTDRIARRVSGTVADTLERVAADLQEARRDRKR